MAEQTKLFHDRRIHLAGGIFLLTERDVKILEFLWKWKQAATATIHEVIGRPDSPYSTYKALERLEKNGYIETILNQRYRFKSWQLTDLGFDSIRESLGDLKEEGFLSENPWHDRNVLAFQLAEWATHLLPSVIHFTEQELRRFSPDSYPSWVPTTGGHRADGYTRISGEKKLWTLAYEIELWPKGQSTYETLFGFYRSHQGIDRVYWLVGGQTVLEATLCAKSSARDPVDNYHLFVDLAEYQTKGWDARVVNCRSENLFTIRENMRGMLGGTIGEHIGNKWGQSAISIHYDPNKVLGKPRR